MTDLRVGVHPADQPWFTGPTAELPPPDWAPRAHKLIRRRVAGIRGVVDRFDADPAVDDLVQRIVERSHAHPARSHVVRWLDARELPVVLEAEPLPRSAPHEHQARLRQLGAGQRLLLDESVPPATPDGPLVQHVVIAPPSDPALPSPDPPAGLPDRVEVRYLVDAGDPAGVALLHATVPAADRERLASELAAIAATARVRPADTAPTPAVRRARRLRRVEAFPVVGIPLAIAALVGLAMPFVVALTAPGGTNGVENWQRALADRPIEETRTIVSWVLAALALGLFVPLRRDAALVREVGERDFGNYVAMAALLIGVGAALGTLPVVAVALGVLAAAVVLRWRDPLRRGRRDRFQAALLVVFGIALLRWLGVEGLRAAAAWELSFSAPATQVEAWVDDRLPSWADLATLDLLTLVLLNLAALLPLGAYLRDRLEFDFGTPFALGVALLLLVVALAGGWTAIVTLVVAGPTLWRRARAYDRARFAALRAGRPAPGLYRGQQ